MRGAGDHQGPHGDHRRPFAMRIGTTIGSALPRVAAVTQRASNAKELADRMAEGQSSYRV